jgi:hypothetical protein
MKYLIGIIVILFTFVVGVFVGARNVINDISRYVPAQTPVIQTVEVPTVKYIERTIAVPVEYVSGLRKVTYAEVVQFIKLDKTDEREYNPQSFDCKDFAAMLKENARQQGIICAVVSLDYVNSTTGDATLGHTINAFDTLDRGIIFVEPQYDIFVDGVAVGADYDYILNIAQNSQYARDIASISKISHITYIW